MLYSFPCPLPSPPARPLSSAICNIHGTFHSFIPALPGCFCLGPGIFTPAPNPRCARTIRTEPLVESTLTLTRLCCFELRSVLQTRSSGRMVTPQRSDVPDPSNLTGFPADRPISSLCQSLPFTGQLFFYQFPWRCECVHVCLRV